MTAPASITHNFAQPADNYSIPKWSPIRCVADHLSDAAYLIMLGDAQHRSHYAAEADRHFRELAKLMGYAVTSLEGGIFGAEAAE